MVKEVRPAKTGVWVVGGSCQLFLCVAVSLWLHVPQYLTYSGLKGTVTYQGTVELCVCRDCSVEISCRAMLYGCKGRLMDCDDVDYAGVRLVGVRVGIGMGRGGRRVFA